MQYKAPQEYNPSSYACYAITSIKEQFTLNTVHPQGLQEYLDYDVFDIGDKTLIAFTKANFFKTDFVYRIVSENYTEDIFYENYDFISDIINNSYDKEKSIFSLQNSVTDYKEAVQGKETPVDDERRCDLEGYASAGFYSANKENAPDMCDRTYLGNGGIVGWTHYICSMSNLYITKIDVKEIDEKAYKDWPIRVLTAQTLPHLVKMVYEWSLLAQEPWNSTDELALKCKGAMEDWSIPQDAIDELLESQPVTCLGLYFSGDLNPRQSIEENSEMSPKFKNWFKSKLRYRTIVSLLQNYPETLEISSFMIEKEKIFFEEQIYKFCIQNKLNPETATAIDLLDTVYFSKKLGKESNNSISDIIKKNLYLDDLDSIKNYENNQKKPHNFSNQSG